MPGPVFLEADRISLRTIEDEDVEFLTEASNHPAVRRYAGGDLPYNRTRYEAERIDPLADGEYLDVLVCDGDERLGDVMLAPIDDRRGWANLGYWIHPDHQGNGYATEAVRRIVTYGFEELCFHRISATIVTDNDPSKRLVEKVGFVHEGTKRDDAFHDGSYVDREIYAILETEWTT